MQKIPPHLRSKIRGDAIRILNTKPFTTAFDAFILGVEYALNEGWPATDDKKEESETDDGKEQ